MFSASPNLSKENFLKLVSENGVPPLYREIPYCEPAALYEAFAPGPNSILFESLKGGGKIAGHSFFAFGPYITVSVKNSEVRVTSDTGSSVSFRPPLERLKELVLAYPQLADKDLPPFQGGAAGLLCYDFVRYIENIPASAVDDLKIPDAHFMLFDKVAAFDHRMKKAWMIISPGAEKTELGYKDAGQIDWALAYDEALEVLNKCCEIAGSAELSVAPPVAGLLRKNPAVRHEMSKEQYMGMVVRAKEYIAAGDIFQANLSQRISADVQGVKPWLIYKTLRSINPSPFAVYADFGEYQIVSSSPERLVNVNEGIVETRPIAGTRPRGRDTGEDETMRADLLLNEKERAEHIMLIDLERNDIGRVCEYGSVNVDELMITEDYSHVIHIVSNVKGTIRKDKTCFDVIKAVFPGGTITGVPKVRCMEIIDELEPVARGPYTGSIGYIGFSKNMDMNIIIRTFLIKDGTAYVQAGAGIVADSDPEREYYETLKKAEALLTTLETLPDSIGPEL
ncbi:MAG: anthranilate synthase component I family protein [Nitrospirae bacterium]|nr:MAG: anthranilate synthase component I family protein [Nitrospirota bacterium]